MTAGGPGAMIGAATMVLLGKWGSRVVSHPGNLRLATLALDKEANLVVRRSAILRLFELYVRDDQGVEAKATRGYPSGLTPPDMEGEEGDAAPTKQRPTRFSQTPVIP